MSRSKKKLVNNNNLAISDWHLRIQNLEEQHQWFLKQIKRKRNELNNFVEQMQTLARELFAKSTPKMREMLELDQEIHKLFDNVLNHRKLGKSTRKKIEDIYESLQELGLISPQESIDSDMDDELDELFRNMNNENQEHNSHNYQQEFNHGDREEIDNKKSKDIDSETREIRKTFLRLASIFHPDKVRDEESHLSHTEIMQEINRAYQEGDLAKLLEIEKKHKIGEKIDISNENDLTRQCQLLEERNNLLKNQYEDLKRELRLVKNTSEGQMVSDYRQAKREKVDMIAEMLKELDQRINLIKEVRDFVKDFKEQKITIKRFLEGPESLQKSQKEMMERILEQMYDEMMGEDFDFF